MRTFHVKNDGGISRKGSNFWTEIPPWHYLTLLRTPRFRNTVNVKRYSPVDSSGMVPRKLEIEMQLSLPWVSDQAIFKKEFRPRKVHFSLKFNHRTDPREQIKTFLHRPEKENGKALIEYKWSSIPRHATLQSQEQKSAKTDRTPLSASTPLSFKPLPTAKKPSLTQQL